jgi:cyclase
MSLAKRIIPCLDVKDGRTVKGLQFVQLRDMGDPVELAERYAEQGADELVFLDISATEERRKTLSSLVRRIAERINIPFTVGGGIKSEADVECLLEAGCDKVSLNSAAVVDPDLIDRLSKRFGAQCVVVAIDALEYGSGFEVMIHGGKLRSGRNVFEWAREAESRGAGEILLTSINRDGCRRGFDCLLTERVSTTVNIPVIASGGAGTTNHFSEVFRNGKADAALAAGIFHEGVLSIPDLKNYLRTQSITVR